jgi:DNA modification methylase
MKNNFISSVWDFSDISLAETNYATHDFLRWYGKLIPQLVSRLIQLYSEEGDLVFANFAGSGTVLVEANILKRDSKGIDSSPLSVLLSRVKTHPYLPDSSVFLEKVKTALQKKEGGGFEMTNDDKKWFHPDSFQDLMTIRSVIDSISNERERDYFLLALASIVRKVSKVDERCINHIVLDKNKPKYDVFSEFQKKLLDMEQSMREFMKIANGNKVEISFGDARDTKLPDNHVDLIISHPPYLGCINYSNIYKLQNRILGFEYDEVKKRDISTDSFSKYIKEMQKVFDEMFRVLKPKKYACVVIGDNRKNGAIQPTFAYFIQYATEQLGFKLTDIFIWVMSQKAGMNIKRRGNHIDHNYILVFQKP